MPIALHSFKVDPDGRVRIAHVFYAANSASARALLEEHAGICPKFGPAFREGATIEIEEEIEQLPEADGDALMEFLGIDADEDEEDDG